MKVINNLKKLPIDLGQGEINKGEHPRKRLQITTELPSLLCLREL